MSKENSPINIQPIFEDIKEKLIKARNKIYTTINSEIIDVYWYIGKTIMELQNGEDRAKYGSAMINALSKKLTEEFGNGFSTGNLSQMKKFYNNFPILQTVSKELSWSHYIELLRIDSKEERDFYLKESINSNWSLRELKRQRNSMLYNRLLLSTDKKYVTEMSEKGQIVKESKDIVKNPYIFEFLGLKENTSYLETTLEKALLSHLTDFLLELGKGFSFVGNQVRITMEGDHFYPDLVFYNRLARCFVIIDLKIGKLTHQDIGQMQMYVNYYKKTQMIDGENEPIGILLCADKNNTVVETTLDGKENIYASKYFTYMPSKEDLINVIESEKSILETIKNEE